MPAFLVPAEDAIAKEILYGSQYATFENRSGKWQYLVALILILYSTFEQSKAIVSVLLSRTEALNMSFLVSNIACEEIEVRWLKTSDVITDPW